MPVHLSAALPVSSPPGRLVNLGDGTGVDPTDIEAAFATIVPDLLALCRKLSKADDAVLAHAPSAAVNASDMGTMLAWERLVADWAAAPETVHVVCGDPWLFRHLLRLPGVAAVTAPPPLWRREIRLALRGLLSRAAFAFRTLRTRMAHRQPTVATGGGWLLSYRHPRSTTKTDGYFGDLMRDLPLRRVQHVDSGPGGISPWLGAWGHPLFPMTLPFRRWRPRQQKHWLVRRAAALEGGGGQAAAVAWQIHCQERWLRAVRPAAVAWPWENHGWERALCRTARRLGVRSIGYQHATIGHTELNYHPATASDGLPDRVLCVGPVARDQLAAWGFAADRLAVGGALRYTAGTAPRHDPTAPVFFALPADQRIATQMVAAATELDRTVLVRPHPIYDVDVPQTPHLRRAVDGLERQPALSAVVFAATTVGLEAVLAGLPTIRFVPSGCVALDILPKPIVVPAADAGHLVQALARAVPPTPLRREDVFAPADLELWRTALAPA